MEYSAFDFGLNNKKVEITLYPEMQDMFLCRNGIKITLSINNALHFISKLSGFLCNIRLRKS